MALVWHAAAVCTGSSFGAGGAGISIMLGEAVLVQELSFRTLKNRGSAGGWCSGKFRCHVRVSRWVADLGWFRVRYHPLDLWKESWALSWLLCMLREQTLVSVS